MYTQNIHGYHISLVQCSEKPNHTTEPLFELDPSGCHRKTLSLTVEKDGCTRTCFFVVPCCTNVEACMLPTETGLFFLFDWILCLFNLESITIGHSATLNPTGTMFAPYPYQQDFILYGEVEIFRVRSDLSLVWSFSGWDIFVRPSGNEPAIVLKPDCICLHDFSDHYYKLDYDGNLLSTSLLSVPAKSNLGDT